MKKIKCILSILTLICIIFSSGCVVFDEKNESGGNNDPTATAPGQEGTPAPGAEITATPEAGSTPTVEPTATPQPLPLAGLKVCIDAGHQLKSNTEKEPLAPWNTESLKTKVSSGTQGAFTNIPEYVINLEISLKLRDALVALGAEVVMIRETHDVNISNLERATISNENKVDITLRIHCNGAASASAKGIEIYVRGSGDGSAEYAARSAADYAIGDGMLKEIIATTGANNRGTKKSDAYVGTNWCESPCLILECGFMSNEEEDRLLSTPEYQDKIVAGIVNYFMKNKIS